MKPKIKLGGGKAPDGTLLELYEHDGHHEIRVGGLGVMESRMHHSEMELARLGCVELGEGAVVMIGGLGIGYTLRATLDLLPANGRAIQVELIPEIVQWNRDTIGHHAGHPLDDERTELIVDDFAVQVRKHKGTLDAILVDIDNGPSALLNKKNAWVYSKAGLDAMQRALAPKGRIALWSAYDESLFMDKLRSRGLEVEQHKVHARPKRKGPKYYVIVCRKR